MDTLSLNWMGPYSLDQTTPDELKRKMGLYAVTCGGVYMFVGKAKHGKGMFRAAKDNREDEYWEGLRRLKLVSQEKPALYRVAEQVYSNCSLYAGVTSKEEIGLLDDAEKLLAFVLKPTCNDKYVNSYEGARLFQVKSSGSLPPALSSLILTPGSGLQPMMDTASVGL